MKRSRSRFSKIKKIFLSIFIVLILVLGSTTYFALNKLFFRTDFIMSDGRSWESVAAEIRTNLLAKGNINSVEFMTEDGLKLSGLLLKRKHAVGNIVVCHGFQSSKEYMKAYFDMFSSYNVLLFDFRAHGQSEGRFRTLGCHEYKDVIAAAKFLKETTKVNECAPDFLPTIIVGFSMGGASAVRAVEADPGICDALILDSTFSSLKDVIYNAFYIKSGILSSYVVSPILTKIVNFIAKCDIGGMRPMDSLKNINKPIMFIHSCCDSIVPPTNSLQMYAVAASEKKKLWIAPACEHGELLSEFTEMYQKKVEKFLKKNLA